MQLDLVSENDPILGEKAISYSKEEIKADKLGPALFKFMIANKGIGIAGNQVGVLKRIICIHVPGFSAIMYNPMVLKQTGKCSMTEGCLSFPGKFINVKRSEKITVKYLDINAKPVYVELDGLAARAVLHETDHLNGKVFTQYE